MGLFEKAADLLGGSTIKTIAETIKAYLPPSMSDAEKSELQLRINEAENKNKTEILKMANEADRLFNDRIIAMEGSAEDLEQVPVIGRVIIMLRGAQRPVWGFLTLYMDLMVFSKKWVIAQGSMESTAFLAINLLVLTFLFGERAVKTILPIVMRYFGLKNGGSDKKTT